MNTQLRRLLIAGTAAALVASAAAPVRAAPGGSLPPVTAQTRAIEKVQPSVVLVRTDWTVRVRGDAGAGGCPRWSAIRRSAPG